MKTALIINGNHVTEEFLTKKFKEYRLPYHMVDVLFLYLVHHISPGSFLLSLLENNFMQCVSRADDLNVHRLVEWAQFLYCEMPAGSHGSPEIVRAWLSQRIDT